MIVVSTHKKQQYGTISLIAPVSRISKALLHLKLVINKQELFINRTTMPIEIKF